MYICYIDESGVPEIPGNTSHYVLAGLALPVSEWKGFEFKIEALKNKYGLKGQEIHTAWLLRKYFEQSKIGNFENLTRKERIQEIKSYRIKELYSNQKNGKSYRQMKKNFKMTEAFVHLTYRERFSFVKEVASLISSENSMRLFAECVDKVHFSPEKAGKSVDEQAFEQVVSRFEAFLNSRERSGDNRFGLLVHDNNQTVALKHTNLMRKYYEKGTPWLEKINHIVETPLFVDSQLTNMVQMADICSYALRRYLENQEEDLFRLVFKRADRAYGRSVGVRHFSDGNCECAICKNH